LKSITIALAGNANVGKSSIFNRLTGLSQHVGNWPGKTVEKAEGTLYFRGYKVKVIDLPGAYSLSPYSVEEVIVRDYLLSREADVVVDVVDASALERNLYLTLQLAELQAPLIIALNQVDIAEKRGIIVDHKRLSEILGVKVVPTVAITGEGLNELLQAIVEALEKGVEMTAKPLTYGKEVEERIKRLESEVRKLDVSEKYPPRWISIKLLERDPLVAELVSECEGGAEVLELANELARELEEMHGEPSPIVIASERYSKISEIVSQVQKVVAPPRVRWERVLDYVTTHPVLGYVILFSTIAGMLGLVFYFGGLLSEAVEVYMGDLLAEAARALLSSSLPVKAVRILVDGLVMGFVAGLVVVLPYVVPFYAILSILEDSGYLARAAYLTDNLMHRIGLHGKAVLPMLLGFGCNVPACVGCRILETDRERLLCGLATIFVPCAARTVVVLGAVGRYLGVFSALSIYLVVFLVLLIIVRLAYKVAPGEPMDLIMEMPAYRRPSLRVTILKTWNKTKGFVIVALPIIMAASAALEALSAVGLTEQLVQAMAPLTVGVLGLPAETAIPLVFGFLRKELALVMLADVLGTWELSQAMTSAQLYTFALVTSIYIPCVATLAALVREFGWRRAILMAMTTLAAAIVVGALAHATAIAFSL